MNTHLVCIVPAQLQVSDGLITHSGQTESSHGTCSRIPSMSPASPSVSAWVQQSVSPNTSISYDAPGECLTFHLHRL